MRISKNTQDKLQQILVMQGYEVRYEKGNFKGGYCLIHDRKTVIINKFFPLEGIIQRLVEIIRELPILHPEILTEEHHKLLSQIKNPSN